MEPNEELMNTNPKDIVHEDNHLSKFEEFRNIKEYDQIDEKYCITDFKIEGNVAKLELLSGGEKKKFWEILKKCKDIIFKKPGRLSIYQHELKIKGDKPFIIKTYPIPIKLRELVTSEINNLLELGIIRRSNCPYILMNPLARKLNYIMINDDECGEPTEVLFQRYGGNKILSIDEFHEMYVCAFSKYVVL